MRNFCKITKTYTYIWEERGVHWNPDIYRLFHPYMPIMIFTVNVYFYFDLLKNNDSAFDCSIL